MTEEAIYSIEDILRMLDLFFRDEGQWWDEFYSDRNREIPFFVNAPDENLVSYFKDERMQCGKALELGCGPGRNALYLSRQGCKVDAVDISEEAILWAKERAKESRSDINFICHAVFVVRRHLFNFDFVVWEHTLSHLFCALFAVV